MPSYPSVFYVYPLVDPKTGVPFYCGKGQRDRAWQHARSVGRGDMSGNARKVAKIQEILTRGDEVEIQIVAEYDLENDALEHEFEIVDSVPELTNAVPGGAGRTLKPEEIARRRVAREKRMLERAIKLRVDGAMRKHDRRKAEMLAIAGKGHAAEIEVWARATQPVEVQPVQFFARMHKGRPDIRFYPRSRPLKKREFEVQKAVDEKVRAEMETAARLEREKRMADRAAYLASLSPRQRKIFKL